MKLTNVATSLEPLAFAALRIVSGALFSFHGIQKIFHVLTTHAPAFGTQLWFGGVIELTCGALIAVGFCTRPAAFLASGTMAVAYTQFHWRLVLTQWKWLPAINQGELAVLYCFVFFFIAMHGPGIAAIDRRR